VARITFEAVDFRYPGTSGDTLAGLDLDIADGEAHALLGASGAGKTTLLNLLSGLLSPTGGHILFDGKDVSRLAGRDRHVAQVFQFPVLYEGLDVEGNLAFPLVSSGMSAEAAARRIAIICEELGITAIRKLKPASLSLFEKQLVAVGKALSREDVNVVLLDEPLTAVEPRIKWRLRQTLRRVQEDLGVTMIYVTHDQTEALTFADRVSVLAKGGILQTGSPLEVYELPAHEFVGHFVGSPGMNFLPGELFAGADGDRIGFRAEWAQLGEKGSLRGVIVRKRVEGTRSGLPFGLVTVSTEFGDVSVRGSTDFEIGAEAGLRVRRCITFREQLRSGEVEFV
jgi:glycerol transport system ATP-binding protein